MIAAMTKKNTIISIKRKKTAMVGAHIHIIKDKKINKIPEYWDSGIFLVRKGKDYNGIYKNSFYPKSIMLEYRVKITK